MDAIETKVSETLGFRIEQFPVENCSDVLRSVALPVRWDVKRGAYVGLASEHEVALWDALLASERSREWIKVTPETMPTLMDTVWLAIPTWDAYGKTFTGYHYEAGWLEAVHDDGEQYFGTEGDSYEVDTVAYWKPIEAPTTGEPL